MLKDEKSDIYAQLICYHVQCYAFETKNSCYEPKIYAIEIQFFDEQAGWQKRLRARSLDDPGRDAKRKVSIAAVPAINFLSGLELIKNLLAKG